MPERVLQFNVASMVEDVLQQHGKWSGDVDLASRKAQIDSSRRYEAAAWLSNTGGLVLGKDFPAEPSEEAFRSALRSGIILCNVLNKVQPGAVPRVVEGPSDAVLIPDGAALTASQYFENVRNFLVAIKGMGIPTFEASDLEQGGKCSRIVNCILVLKSYEEWQQSGRKGERKFGGTSSSKPPPFVGRPAARKRADLFLDFLLKNSSAGEKAIDSMSSDENSSGDLLHDLNQVGISPSLHKLVRELISDKSGEDLAVAVENMMHNVVEEFERRVESQNQLIKISSLDNDDSNTCTTGEAKMATSENGGVPEIGTSSHDKVVPNSYIAGKTVTANTLKDKEWPEKDGCDEAARPLPLKYQESVEHQKRSVQELKNTLLSAKEHMQMLQMKHQEDVDNLGKHVSHLASAAAGYHKVLEENRKLYNQVQDLKGNIRVYCRVRPFLPGQPNGLSVVEDIVDCSLTIPTSMKHGKGKKTFTFNKAFGPSSTQEEVFADTQPLIRSVLDGYNVCIFAYGQTGSGKTFTMTGPKELTKESLGVNYRALSDLFGISEQRKDTIAYDISVQMMEIYNEQVRDLLVTDGVQKKIRNNSPDGINVPHANLVPVTSTSDVINLMNIGHKNRAVGSTSMNDRSSRSHSCLTVHVRGKELTSGTVIRGCMHLVDLAGSERADKTDAVGDRLKEAQHINKSLSALGDVISALAQKNAHVPYRNSKLTQLLQDSLGGQAKTLMFVHISPEHSALGETLSTLKFAERVSMIELGAAKSNKENTSTDVKELKEQIAALKAALARKEGGDLVSCESSPSHSSWNSRAEEQSNASSRRYSLDSQDLQMNSPPRVMAEEKGLAGGLSGADKQGGGGRRSREVFCEKGSRRGSKIPLPGSKKSSLPASRRHSLDTGLARPSRYHTTTDESEDIDAATSDSSESDCRWQLNIPKSNNTLTVARSKLRKPTPRFTKTSEMRSLIPQPSVKVVGTASSVAGRRKSVGGK